MGLKRIMPALLALALATGVLVGITAPAEAQRADVARLQNGWGVNGPVYAVAVSGDTLFVGGDFSAAISRTGASLPRQNLAAFSLRTGRPLREWVANTSGAVHALAVRRAGVWVGGKFTSVNGVPRLDLAKVSAHDGSVRRGFRLDTNGTVRAVAVTKRRIFVGGDFTTAGAMAKDHLVAARPDTGAIITRFRASVNGTVWSVAVRPTGGPLYVGGRFTRLSGKRRASLGAVSRATGRARRSVFQHSSGPVFSIDLSADGRRLVAGVGGAPQQATGNSIAAWNVRTGRRVWRLRVHGDGQAVDVFRKTVYAGFHGGYLEDSRLRLLAIDLHSGKIHGRFRPRFNQYWGVRAIAANRRGIAVGGQFTRVSSVRRQRIAVFAVPRW